MRALLIAAALCLAVPASAAPPPHQAQVAAWAKAAGFRLAAPVSCTGPEEKAFGALGATCWSVKRIKATANDLHPRMVLRLQTFATAADATARIKRFHDPIQVAGEAGKTYPLRAGFRLDDQVLVVTTDAFAFARDAYRAAGELAAATHGTELTCWLDCASR